jgi:Ricin-type beta-trefoil lectin domain
MLSKTGEIRRDEACLDYAGQEVILYPCHGSKGNQYWEYNRAVRKFPTLLQNFTIIYILDFSQNWCATAAAKSALE